jgi:hypothetical protein
VDIVALAMATIVVVMKVFIMQWMLAQNQEIQSTCRWLMVKKSVGHLVINKSMTHLLQFNTMEALMKTPKSNIGYNFTTRFQEAEADLYIQATKEQRFVHPVVALDRAHMYI